MCVSHAHKLSELGTCTSHCTSTSCSDSQKCNSKQQFQTLCAFRERSPTFFNHCVIFLCVCGASSCATMRPGKWATTDAFGADPCLFLCCCCFPPCFLYANSWPSVLGRRSRCVTNEKLISPFRGTYNSDDGHQVSLYAYLKAFRFTGSPALYLECDIHMCHNKCPVSCCQAPFRPVLRKQRNDTRSASLCHHDAASKVLLEEPVQAIRAQLRRRRCCCCRQRHVPRQACDIGEYQLVPSPGSAARIGGRRQEIRRVQ